MGRAWRDQVVESWALVVCSFGHVFRANSQKSQNRPPGPDSILVPDGHRINRS